MYGGAGGGRRAHQGSNPKNEKTVLRTWRFHLMFV